MAKVSRRWTRDELLLTFELYCQTPFGKLHRNNLDVIALASALNRTPSAVAMKLVNFASLDEVQQARGIKGLANSSRADREVVEEFKSNWGELVFEASQVRELLLHAEGIIDPVLIPSWDNTVPTERMVSNTRVRVAQAFFRKAVLTSYDDSCAICEIRHAKLLNASHIIPWSADDSRRADPTNGLCLCAIHDRAFDRGLLAIDHDYHIVLSEMLADEKRSGEMFEPVFGRFAGQPIKLPQRFQPSQDALRFHYERIFLGTGLVG